MITYSWEINKVDKVSADGMDDVIETVHWYAEATDGVYVTHEVGELTLEAPDPDRFIEFGNLTKLDIVGWLHDFDRIDLAPHAIRAGVDGIVIAQAWAVRVVQGQHVVVTGRVLPWRS